ncbi:MAG: pantetheine-phosphate adenylyltransferase [Bacteroidaceae bacterium]|nr:pantetheine-phosphate adenylyltransferase [Bacteroidaceae bacterium]
MKTAVFTGSFNPFTIGHADIVRRALSFSDRIIIGVVGDNVHKALTPAAERCAAIARLYDDEPRVEVRIYNGLAVDFAHEVHADAIIKGVRSVKDFEYEREQAEANRHIGDGLETILLPADPSLTYISSSLVRELQHFGRDVSDLLPASGEKNE